MTMVSGGSRQVMRRAEVKRMQACTAPHRAASTLYLHPAMQACIPRPARRCQDHRGAGSRRTVSKPRDTVPTNLSRETALAPAHTIAAAAAVSAAAMELDGSWADSGFGDGGSGMRSGGGGGG